MRRLFGALLVAIVAFFLSCSSSVPEQCYTNPILAGDYPDPTIMREGYDYYMTHSAFDYLPGLTVFHSTDLVIWEPISSAITTYIGSVWAPDICKYQDKYYIYFAVSHPEGKKNFVVWSTSPYGPWSEPIDLKVGNIDPCHAVGEDGKRWLFMSDGKRVQLTDDGLAIIPHTMEVVYEGWKYPKDWLTEGMYLEGPKIRKIGDYYYFLSAEGGTAGPPTSHMVVVARSKSIHGPWENSPTNPLVHTYDATERWWSKGHGSLIDTPNGDWWVVYHAYENGFYNLGRQTLMEPVKLGDDGWFHPVVKDVAKPIKAPLPLGEKIDNKAHISEFRIGYEWKFYKSFDPERAKVENGTLTLQGRGSRAADSYPILFVAGDHSYEIEAEIELHGNVSAGLILFYNKDFFVGTGFDKEGRYRYRKAERGSTRREAASKMWLRLRNDKHIVTGEYSFDGITWQHETWCMMIDGYHHNVFHQFLSVLPGLFCAGDGYATFKNFKYQTLD